MQFVSLQIKRYVKRKAGLPWRFHQQIDVLMLKMKIHCQSRKQSAKALKQRDDLRSVQFRVVLLNSS